MRCAIYCRCSTSDKGQDPNTQLHPLRTFCESQGWQIIREYVDLAAAGDMARRVGWRQLLDDAHKGKFEVLLVYRLDRAFRSVLDAALTLASLRAWRVGFRSYGEPYLDTTSPYGEAMFYITSAYAALERGILSQRTRDGMARARAEGKSLGRPRGSRDKHRRKRGIRRQIAGDPFGPRA